MKKVYFSGIHKDKYFTVDDPDYQVVIERKWYLNKGRPYMYKSSHGKNHSMSVSTFIMGKRVGWEIDHIDHNPLNNSRKNLRYTTRSENSMNRRVMSNNKTGYKGVFYDSHHKKYRSGVNYKGKCYYGSYTDDMMKAVKEYNQLAKKYFGEFACINEI